MKKWLIVIGLILLSGQSLAETDSTQFNQTSISANTLKSTVKIGILNHGTGWYIGENELITNDHVIEGQTSPILFQTYDGKRCTAKVLYREDSLDLALLSTDCTGAPLELTESFTVGQSVLAVGNPDSYDFTVTSGIVSGQKWDMIQTDARVSGGSSGGPLVDVKGRVIGVIVAKDKAFDYIGFAISSKEVNKFLERAK